MKKVLKNNKGFTLLFTSLIVSLILSISLSIAATTLSQFLLSSSGRESQLAFYNADSGIECAKYYDSNKVDYEFANHPNGYYPTSQTEANLPLSITCTGKVAQPNNTLPNITVYNINMPGPTCEPSKPSFVLKITRTSIGARFATKIESRGYNTCDTTNPRRLERGLQANY